MKRFICLITVVTVFCTFAACGETTSSNNSYHTTNYSYRTTTQSKEYESYQSNDSYIAHDWMKDQAQDKNYGYDDGGSYYCMGKNDTCKNKTNNKYDLYCSSCDPDGDNIEG